MTAQAVAADAAVRDLLRPADFDRLPGWQHDELVSAATALRLSCGKILTGNHKIAPAGAIMGKRSDWRAACRAAQALPESASTETIRSFFEEQFRPFEVNDRGRKQGVFTGYFEPEVRGSLTPSVQYPVPVYAKPADLVTFNARQQAATGVKFGRIVNGVAKKYSTRKQIEQGALKGRAKPLLWLADWADAFFMHIQGSGSVRLQDGRVVRLAFAAKSGLPYTAIGGILIKRGEITRENMSMQSIRAWLTLNSDQARELMWRNQSYIFFRQVRLEHPRLGPPGAQQVQLTPLRSLAVDRRHWGLGLPFWLDTKVPLDGRLEVFQRLMIAQDTGSAIIGRIRGDIFFGAGDKAAIAAGEMKSKGRIFVLLPKAVVRRYRLKN